jgi:hypothetical protein
MKMNTATHRKLDRQRLERILSKRELTKGLYVRPHGDHVILGRYVNIDRDGEPERDDRIRFTRLTADQFGLSVKRHTGRWERTPFTGNLEELADVIMGCMQHLIAEY